MTFNLLFVATSVGFAVSALLVLATRIPNARRSTHRKAWDRIASGVRIFVTTPRLRGIMALNLVVAAAGSIVVVNTVNYVRDELGGTQSDVAWMLAASGTGTLVTALLLPRVLDRTAERTVMTAGSVVLVVSAGAAAALAVVGVFTWMLTAAVWALVGAGMAMIVTPTGKVLRRSVDPAGIPEVFAAQFSLSHLAWLVTYPIAGWVGSSAGFAVTWSILAALAAVGAVAGFALWPRETVAELPVQAAYETTRGECTLAATSARALAPSDVDGPPESRQRYNESGGAAIACTTTLGSTHVGVLPRICVESRTTSLAAEPVPISFEVTEQAFRFGTHLLDHAARHDPTFDEFTTASGE